MIVRTSLSPTNHHKVWESEILNRSKVLKPVFFWWKEGLLKLTNKMHGFVVEAATSATRSPWDQIIWTQGCRAVALLPSLVIPEEMAASGVVETSQCCLALAFFRDTSGLWEVTLKYVEEVSKCVLMSPKWNVVKRLVMENRFQQTTISFRGFAPTSSDSSLSQVNQVPSSERNVFHPAPFLGRLHDWKLPHAFGISNQFFVLYTISSYVKHENLKDKHETVHCLASGWNWRTPHPGFHIFRFAVLRWRSKVWCLAPVVDKSFCHIFGVVLATFRPQNKRWIIGVFYGITKITGNPKCEGKERDQKNPD